MFGREAMAYLVVVMGIGGGDANTMVKGEGWRVGLWLDDLMVLMGRCRGP